MRQQKMFFTGINEKKISIPLLKSNLQKAIRRGKADIALKTAKALIINDEKQLLRRLPIIALEDVALHLEFPFIINLMKSKNKMNENEKNRLLNIVYQLSVCKVRDAEYEMTSYRSGVSKLKIDKTNLNKQWANIMDSIEIRHRYFALSNDARELKWFGWKWANRVSTKDGAKKYMEILSHIYKTDKTIKYQDIPNITKKDILLEAIDNHCSPIIDILSKQEKTIKIFKRFYPKNQNIKDTLKDMTWVLRGAINNRADFATGIRVDWFKNAGYWWDYKKDDQFKYNQIFSRIKKDLDNLSLWFISKQNFKP